MAFVIADRVRETTESTGTGVLILDGAPEGFQRFTDGIGSGNTCPYTIVDLRTGDWESGKGTFQVGAQNHTLQRDTVTDSSNLGSKVDFESGEKEVFSNFISDIAVVSGAQIDMDDDVKFALGDDEDYWFVYDSSGTQFRLRSTDTDGGGADGDIFTVQDGGDVLDFSSTPTVGGTAVSLVGHSHAASDVTSGTFADARISESSVTQHEAALAIAGTQLTGTVPDARLSANVALLDRAAQEFTGAENYFTGGNVGIGTDSPGVPLEVSASESRFRMRSSAAGGQVWDFTSGGGSALSAGWFAFQRGGSVNVMQFSDDAAADVIRVDGSFLGVGETTPAATLHVGGDTIIGTDPGGSELLRVGGAFRAEGSDIRAVIADTSIGESSITQDIHGLELHTGGMNSSSKFGTGIKFSSTDPAFTTEDPKFLAGIFPRATEAYASDSDSGMAIDFLTTPKNAGGSPTPSVRMSIEDNGDVIVGTDPGGSDLLRVGGFVTFGNAFTGDATTDEGILNLLVGDSAPSGHDRNGIVFYENTTPFRMSLQYDGSGTGGDNLLGFYDDSGQRIIAFKNDESVIIGTDPGGGMSLRVGGGLRVDGSIISDDEIQIKEISTPSNASSGWNKLYFKSDDNLYKLDDAGNEVQVGGGLTDDAWVARLVDSPNGTPPVSNLEDGESVEITILVPDGETLKVYRWGAYRVSDGTAPTGLDVELLDGSDTVQDTANTTDNESTDYSSPVVSHANSSGSDQIFKLRVANDTGSTEECGGHFAYIVD